MIICKIWSQCTCKLWMIFTYCKTNNISYWYLYLLTEGEIVIIMDKASTKALLYWPHYGKVNSAMPKCLIFINKKWSMLKFNISHKAKWMQAEAKTLYPFKCIYILSFIFFFYLHKSSAPRWTLSKKVNCSFAKLITVVHKKSNNTYEIVTKFSEKNLLIISSIHNKGL